MRDKVFISHRKTDEFVAIHIKHFLNAVGVSPDAVFCSSLPGNDVDNKIDPEVKENLKRSAVILLLLSESFYESAYCLNEAGVAWYLDEDVTVIPISLGNITEEKMVGFLNSGYRLYNISDVNDVCHISDIILEALRIPKAKSALVNREATILTEQFCSSPVRDSKKHELDVITSHAYVALVNAGETGLLTVTDSVVGKTYLAGRHNLNASDEHEEIALWDDVVEYLVERKMIREKSYKGAISIYELTTFGYTEAKRIKSLYGVEADMQPREILARIDDMSENKKISDRILEKLKACPRITVTELAQEIGVSRKLIEKEIAVLRETGQIQRVGTPKDGYWISNE